MPVSLLSGFLQRDSCRRWVGDSGPLHARPYSSNTRTVGLASRLCFVCPSKADDLHDESNEMRAFFSCFPLPHLFFPETSASSTIDRLSMAFLKAVICFARSVPPRGSARCTFERDPAS